MEFKKPFEKASNLITKIDEQNYISYNGNMQAKETALKINGYWFILEGDLRKYFKKCKTLEDVVNIFKEKSKEYKISSRSTLHSLDDL